MRTVATTHFWGTSPSVSLLVRLKKRKRLRFHRFRKQRTDVNLALLTSSAIRTDSSNTRARYRRLIDEPVHKHRTTKDGKLAAAARIP
ncbi:hypothetical protein FBX98_12952 [Burkholderia sp. SJZ115]|nr:hypothetical protein FB600_13052 [Burkholderia sp. SJZ089]TWC94675.1 hypothetical protein FBX98_12952 [Burkholderia sp. SJZ115]TWC96587.1 hypothetical protein FB601_13052 [Burkholderia sp. SJZ091]